MEGGNHDAEICKSFPDAGRIDGDMGGRGIDLEPITQVKKRPNKSYIFFFIYAKTDSIFETIRTKQTR